MCPLQPLQSSCLCAARLGLRIPSHGPQGTGFARQLNMVLCRQEGDTSARGKDASQGQHALVIEVFFARAICILRAHVRNHGWEEVVEDRARGI